MEYLTTRQAGEMLRCTPTTVIAFFHSGKLRGSHVSPRKYLIEKDSVIELLENGRNEAKHNKQP